MTQQTYINDLIDRHGNLERLIHNLFNMAEWEHLSIYDYRTQYFYVEDDIVVFGEKPDFHQDEDKEFVLPLAQRDEGGELYEYRKDDLVAYVVLGNFGGAEEVAIFDTSNQITNPEINQ